MEKSSLRKHFRQELKTIPEEERRRQSESIWNRLHQHLQGAKGQTWSLFAPLGDEPDLMMGLESLPVIRWTFPLVEGSGPLNFFQVSDPSELKASPLGPLEPNPNTCKQIPQDEIHGFIIPALAYDKSGVRLGRGGGYFDQTLVRTKGQKIGVIFEESLSSQPLPKEDHDQCVDHVVTSKTWIKVRGQSWT